MPLLGALETLANEHEALVRTTYGPENRYTVNRGIINSKAYHDKFAALPFARPVYESLYRMAGRILSDRDGTRGERMAAIDGRTGIVVVDTFFDELSERSEVYFNEYERRAIVANGSKVVFIHNHPGSTYPSAADVISAVCNEYVVASIVVGHDGTVWCVEPVLRAGMMAVWKRLYDEAKQRVSDRGEAKALAFSRLETANGGGRWYRIQSM